MFIIDGRQKNSTVAVIVSASADGSGGDGGHTANSSEALINSCQCEIKRVSRLHRDWLAASISMH